MANVKDVKSKVVTITLNDGVERTLKYDLNAMAELEDKYGSVDAAFEAVNANSIKAIRCVLWAGLIHAEPELTERQVGSMIDMAYLANLVDTMGEAFEADMPPVPEESGVADPNA